MNEPHTKPCFNAEADLLGALFRGDESHWRATRDAGVVAAAFGDWGLRTIFAAMEAVDCSDIVAVSAELERAGNAVAVGGRQFLADLMSDRVPGPAHAARATDAVLKAWRFRRIAEAASRVTAAARAESAETLARELEALAVARATDGWEEPAPFPDKQPPPPFPLDVFPDWLADWATVQAQAKCVAVDVPALLALGVVATAAMKKLVVAPNEGFREPINLYLVLALPSGEGKSPAFKAAFAPLRDYEGRRRAEEAPEAARTEAERALLTKRVEALERKFAGAKSADLNRIREELDGAREQLAALPPPRAAFRLTADDVTVEKLEELLAEHGERIAVVSSEGGIFGLLDGRYSEKGGPNFDLYLKAYSGDAHLCDRIGRQGGKLDAPCVVVAITVQPAVVAEILGNAAFSGRGLVARCYIVGPESRVGFRDVRDADAVNTSAADAAYAAKVGRLLATERPEGVPHDGATATLSPEAREVWTRFREATEQRLRDGGDLEDLRDFGNKLGGGLLRVAGLLHFMDRLDVADAAFNPIPAATMRRAVALCDYFAAHQLRSFVGAGEVERIEAARAALRWIRKRKLLEVLPRDLQRGLGKTGRRFGRAEACVEALETLAGFGWLRRKGDGGAFSVNPAAHVADADKSSDKSDMGDGTGREASDLSDATRATADLPTVRERTASDMSDPSDDRSTRSPAFRSIAEEGAA
jgi:replicative DNA helicase